MSCPPEGGAPPQASSLPDPLDDLTSPHFVSVQACCTLYAETNTLSHLEDAIQLLSNTAPLTPFASAMLSQILATRHERTGDPSDLQRALEIAREVIDAVPTGHPKRGEYLANLATQLRSSYQLRDALDVPQEMRDVAPPPPRPVHPELQGFMASLVRRIHSTYGPMDELDSGRAMLYCAEAWVEMPGDDRDPEGFMTRLSTRLRSRYEQKEDIHPQHAIECCRAAWAETPQDHPDRAGFQSNLAPTPHDTYQRLGHLDELQQAVQYFEEALAATPQTDPSYTRIMSNLAKTLCDRYQRMDSLADLQRAMLYDEEVLTAIPHDDPERPIYLCSAAENLSTRHQRIGDFGDLQQAILYATAAVAAQPVGSPYRARCWILLSMLLVEVFPRRQNLDELSQAISYAEQAIVVTPLDHPMRKQYLHHLANAMEMRYCYLEDPTDSACALSCIQELLQTIPLDLPQRAVPLSTLSGFLTQRYIRERDLKFLQGAIQFAEEAATIMTQYDPNRAHLLFCLATLLREQANVTGTYEDGAAILHIYREAWGCRNSPPSTRILAAQQAVIYLQRDFRFEEASLLLQDCIQMLQKVSPRSLRQEDREHRLAGLSGLAGHTASGILLQGRTLHWLEVGRSLGFRLLRGMANRVRKREGLPAMPPKDPDMPPALALVGLARGSVAGTILAKDAAYHALKFLELGRGTIISSAIDCRSDLSDLKVTHPALAEKFDNVRTEIDTPLPERIDGGRIEETKSSLTTAVAYHLRRTHASRSREAAIHEMDDMLVQIRKLQGHTGFQLPPSAEELTAMAKNGPIVTFVTSPISSDAIIVTSTTITSLRLSNLEFCQVPERLACITKNTARKAAPKKKASRKPARVSPGKAMQEYAERNSQMRELLLWLWDVAVEPVLQKLELTEPTTGTKLPHIWWIGVGPLSMAPFHAAGDHSPGSSRNTMSCVISSYTPTIKALFYARERDLDLVNNPDAQLLLVTMPKTPGEKDLPDVDREVSEIVDITTGSITTKHLERPSADQVLEHFQAGKYNAMHFACHGISDAKEPSKSHLVLLKAPTVISQPPVSETADQLTVQNISQMKTKAGQLAYLSACSTARNSVANLADETILIASGFQLAGFSHVLATLWPSESDVCKEVAIDFYRSLFNGQDKGIGHRKVSMAFHEATKRARDKHPLLPRKWAPFIHMGA